MGNITMEDSGLVGTIELTALGLLLLGGFAVIALMIRDTIRQRGKWGLNFKPTACTECGTPAPQVRLPANWRQATWGGWTCAECGLELDKWGRPIEGQNAPAKWKVLRAAEEAKQREHRPKSPDERIREVNDQTQRGDAL
jgi:hypothetical protein